MNTDTKELPARLREFNRWRRGDETLEQPHPARIGAMIDEAADRLEELERELNAKDAHADEIYKAAVALAAKLEDDLEKERKLADRLAHWLSEMADEFILPAELENGASNALAAWKEARRDS
jgi:Skp family chaperone for outer membrane proteins